MKKLWLRDFYTNGKWGLLLALALYLLLMGVNLCGDMSAAYMLAFVYGATLSFMVMTRDEFRGRHTLMLALPVTRRTLATHRYAFSLVTTLALCVILALFTWMMKSIGATHTPLVFTPQLLLLSLVIITIYIVCFVPLTLIIGGGWAFVAGVGALVAAHVVIDALIRHARGGAPIPESCVAASAYESWLAWLQQAWSPVTVAMIVAGLIAVHGLALWLTVKGFERREA